MVKIVPVQDALGMVLCHDITAIIPGEFKGRAFKKGHIVREEDIPRLLDIGKESLFVLNLEPGWVHENEAAERLAKAIAGPGLRLTDVCEGRVDLVAEHDGLLKINIDALTDMNMLESVTIACLHGNQPVKAGRAVAGARIVPLTIEEARIVEAEAIAASARATRPVVEVLPFRRFEVGLVTTGNEIYHGRVKDAFGPVIRNKVAEFGSTVLDQSFVSDDPELTVAAIHEFLNRGAEMIVCTGGMSVDPDDRTPSSIRAAGGEVATYGSPTLPGAMFMLAYVGEVPILGLPGCVMYHKASIFDLILPRLLAGERLTRRDIAILGHGGFCSRCESCHYPVCPFGKGS